MKQRFNEEFSNDNGDMLVDFSGHNNITINKTFFDHDLTYKYTFENSHGYRSVIDYIIISRHFTLSNILELATLNSGNIGSDSSLLLDKIRCKSKLQWEANSDQVEKITVKLLEAESIKNLYATRLENKISRAPIAELDTPEFSKLQPAGQHQCAGTANLVHGFPQDCSTAL
ncbi:hypothetical protein Trydic_g1896 [Trypoxylus dichotomus]